MNYLVNAFPAQSRINKETIELIINNYKIYIVFITPRSGSTWLTEIAKNTQLMGVPHELLNETFLYGTKEELGVPTRHMIGSEDINEYFHNIVDISSSDNKVFGIEIGRWHAEFIETLIERTNYNIENASLFYLRRKNIVAQGISLYRSVVSSAWHSHTMDAEARSRYESVDYDGEQISYWIKHIFQDYEIWFCKKFHEYGTKPIDLYYEDLELNPRHVIGKMLSKILGRVPEFEARSIQVNKLRDCKSVEWEQRFRSERADFVFEVEKQRVLLE